MLYRQTTTADIHRIIIWRINKMGIATTFEIHLFIRQLQAGFTGHEYIPDICFFPNGPWSPFQLTRRTCYKRNQEQKPRGWWFYEFEEKSNCIHGYKISRRIVHIFFCKKNAFEVHEIQCELATELDYLLVACEDGQIYLWGFETGNYDDLFTTS